MKTPISALMRNPLSDEWLAFEHPLRTLEARTLDEVLPLLEQCEEATKAGHWAVGYISYEAAAAFDSSLETIPAAASTQPLVRFDIYDHATTVPEPASPDAAAQTALAGQRATPSINRSDYSQAIATIRSLIAAGDSYQVNFTYRLEMPAPADTVALFAQLAEGHRPPCAASLEYPDFAVCSLSPELFFHRDGEHVVSRPMKGTARRAPLPDEDRAAGEALSNCVKNRAENVMIVDMIRNDLGRIALPGSVKVPALFALERYPTVWQMTSTVTARTTASTVEILKALFPCASITGAPKTRTMQIIKQLERSPRGIYCGAIGLFAPGERAWFNVAIRTAVIDRGSKRLSYGVGGGIVWDSSERGEYAETQAKAAVLGETPPRFSLLETIRWEPQEGFYLLERHLQRMACSADYFDYCFDEAAVRRELAAAVQSAAQAMRVRLLLGRRGQLAVETFALSMHGEAENDGQPVRLRLATAPIDPASPFLYHKTTHRATYETARRAAPDDCDDVILWNRRGEVTECTIANLIFTIDGKRFTPPLSSGLLAGTYRAELLAQGDIEERSIPVTQLRRIGTISVINSVRGERPAQLLL